MASFLLRTTFKCSHNWPKKEALAKVIRDRHLYEAEKKTLKMSLLRAQYKSHIIQGREKEKQHISDPTRHTWLPLVMCNSFVVHDLCSPGLSVDL